MKYDDLTIQHLKALSLVSSGLWAFQNIPIDGARFDISDTPYLRELYDNALTHEVVARKAAQTRFTTWAIITTLWFLKNPLYNQNALYLFPTLSQVYDFSSGRLNPMLEDSPAFTGDEKAAVDNQGLKRFGKRTLYMKGTESSKQLVEFPAAWQVFDEVDKFKEHEEIDIIKLAKKRASGSKLKIFKYLSNPTYPDVGIDAMYLKSSMGEWQVPCNFCGKWQALDFFENVEYENINSGVFCKYCKKPIDRLAEGRWYHEDSNNPVKGYHVSQLSSPTVSVREMIAEWLAIEGELDKAVFYNMSLGLPYTPKGGKLTQEELRAIISSDLTKGDITGYSDTFLGIDVGNMMDWALIGRDYSILDWGEARNIEEIYEIIETKNVTFFCIDAQPEGRLSKDLVAKYPNRGAYVYYKDSENTKEFDDGTYQFNRNREVTLDRMYHRIRSKKARAPQEIKQSDLEKHLCNLVKVVQDKKIKQTKVVKFMRYNKPDHKAHGLNYAMMAADFFEPPRLRFL